MDKYTRVLLQGYVKGIRVETNVNEPFTIEDPFAEPDKNAEPGVGDAVIEALQPKVTLILGQGLDNIVIAPAGDPSPGTRKAVQAGGIVAGVGVVGLLGWLLARKRK